MRYSHGGHLPAAFYVGQAYSNKRKPSACMKYGHGGCLPAEFYVAHITYGHVVESGNNRVSF